MNDYETIDVLSDLSKFYTLVLLHDEPRHGYRILNELSNIPTAKNATTVIRRNLDIRIVAEPALKRPRRLFEDIENLSSFEIRRDQLVTKK